MRFQAILCSTFFLLASVGMTGCGVGKATQAAKPHGFIERVPDGATGNVSEKYPFHYVWTDRKRSLEKNYAEQTEPKVYIAPVGTNYLEQLEWKDRWLRESVSEVGNYLHDRIIFEIERLEPGILKPAVVETREEADYAIEIELVEVGFGDPALYVAVFAVPVPGVATAYDVSHTSVLAFESRIIHIPTGEIVSTVADRKIPKLRILDLNKAVSKTAPLRDIANDWADEIARSLSHKEETEKIQGTSAFTLIPW